MNKAVKKALIPLAILTGLFIVVLLSVWSHYALTPHSGSFNSSDFLPILLIFVLSIAFIIGHLLCVYSKKNENSWWVLGGLLILAAIVLSIYLTISMEVNYLFECAFGVMGGYLILYYLGKKKE